MSSSEPDYLAVNRESWTRKNAEYTGARAAAAWAKEEIDWGVWGVLEADLGVLPDVAGKDVIELGCGTAYFAAWLAKRGARRVVGIDITPAQLDTARRLNEEHGLGLELVEANAEDVPLPDASFDLALSEYGASIWCDPYKWIPEAARLLRPGGHLVFLRNSTISILCATDDGWEERLVRPQRGLHRLEWTDDDPGIEFHLGHGDWLRLLRDSGFEVEDLIELFAPEGAENHSYYYSSAEWAKKWPFEEIWRVRKRG